MFLLFGVVVELLNIATFYTSISLSLRDNHSKSFVKKHSKGFFKKLLFLGFIREINKLFYGCYVFFTGVFVISIITQILFTTRILNDYNAHYYLTALCLLEIVSIIIEMIFKTFVTPLMDLCKSKEGKRTVLFLSFIIIIFIVIAFRKHFLNLFGFA